MFEKKRKNKTAIAMTEEEFNSMLNEAKISKEYFLEFTGYYLHNLYRWAREKEYPPYIKSILTWAVKAQKYNELINKDNNEKCLSDIKVKILKEKNQALKEEIKGYREIENLYNEIVKK